MSSEAPAAALPAGYRISVIGLGGIGGIVVRYLSVFLKSQQAPFRLTLIDGDEYTLDNESRQLFSGLGHKADVQAADTLALLGESQVMVVALPEFVTPENVLARVQGADLIFLCVDDHGVRRLVSDCCTSKAVSDITLISGGNEAVEPPAQRGTYGNVQVYVKRGGRELTVPITRYYPQIAAAPWDPQFGQEGCGQIAASAPQILFTNLAVASAMLNAFHALACGRLNYQEVKLDILDARMLPQFPVDTLEAPGAPATLTR